MGYYRISNGRFYGNSLWLDVTQWLRWSGAQRCPGGARQLKNKRVALATVTLPVTTEPVTVTATSALTEISEAEAEANIYIAESSNRIEAINWNGCIGLGQDCNGTLVLACPDWATNRPCQETYWEGYMARRYGTWVKAWNHWLARVPINGVDVGNWW